MIQLCNRARRHRPRSGLRAKSVAFGRETRLDNMDRAPNRGNVSPFPNVTTSCHAHATATMTTSPISPNDEERATTRAPLALGVAAVVWLMAACFYTYLFYPTQHSDGSFSSGFGVDLLSFAQAQSERETVLLIFCGCLLAAGIHAAVALIHGRSPTARSVGVVFGVCYAILALLCIVEWFGHRSAPALLVYAGISGALSIPMLAGASHRRDHQDNQAR